MRIRPLLSASACLAIFTAASSVRAEVVNVSDVAELLAAVAAAAPGDEIVLADGTYAIAQNVSCSAVGTAGQPIVVRAASPLGATIELDALEGFKVSGAHWHFEGLDVRGTCASDSDCEHAFHVVGAASGFTLRDSVVVDFNAQLKVNAEQIEGTWTAPDDGVIERNEIYDTLGRQTSNPVTKLNIDGGERWIVRDNFLHDFEKDGGNTVSYGAFMKSGGADGVFERNLVLCTSSGDAGGARIGLSFGGGGTAPQFCAPAYDAGVPCDPEHTGGTLRNNIIASCSDVGIYLNLAADTKVLFNTMVGTAGVDFRFASSSGVAHGNVLAGTIDDRDGGTHTEGPNLENVAQGTFDGFYTAPLDGDLSLAGDVSALIGQATPHPDVTDDYCLRPRDAATPTLGALEHQLGDCDTVPPPGTSAGSGAGSGAGGGAPGAGGAGAGTGGSGPAVGPGAGAGGQTGGDGPAEEDEGCGCSVPGAGRPNPLALGGWLALGLVAARRALRSKWGGSG